MHKHDYNKKAQMSSGHGSIRSNITVQKPHSEESLLRDEGCSSGVTAHPGPSQEALQHRRNFRSCYSSFKHAPLLKSTHLSNARGGQAEWPGHSTVTQTSKHKQTNKQKHLTAKKESPKAAADFPPVPVTISHEIRKPNLHQLLCWLRARHRQCDLQSTAHPFTSKI